ncbi:MAG TPA: ABC transporter permease [Vicinamibacterales bacterium]|nr:ABC transporter permease [Vicinamibacterales bacterium]
MRDDVKAAFRSFRSSKTFTAVALLVLTLGIGASTAIFSVVDAVVLRGLPFDEHDRLVAVGERRAPAPDQPPGRDPASLVSIAPQNFMDWTAQQQVFESMAAITGRGVTLREPGAEPEDLRAQMVTASFLDVLRVRPAMGRMFTADNESAGRHLVVLLSDGFWRRRFGADPAIVGRTIPLEGNTYEVIGVMAPDFAYPIGSLRPTDLWMPYVVPPDERVRQIGNSSFYLQSIARLKPGVTILQAQAQMDQIAAGLQQAHPVWNRGRTIGVRPLRDHLVGASTKSWMLMLLGAVGIVLLIACANVANLLLARASAREREVGIRAALGAGRWRIIRQLMVESLVLSVIATVLAVMFAWWAVQVLRTSMPEGVPRVASIALDLRVLATAAGLSILTGILFGIVPALQLSRPDLTHALKDGSRGSVGAGRQHLRSALVVVEVALAVVLLVGAALFIGSFMTLMRIQPGFDTGNVLTASVAPRFPPGTRPPDNSAAYHQLLERISGIPGVAHAAMISGGVPLSGSMSSTSISIPGRTIENDRGGVSIRRISPQYHQAMGIPLRSGRFFEATDRAGSPNVLIVNEAFVKQYFPGESPLGRSVTTNDADRTIVGVVGDVHQVSLETEPVTEMYVPIGQIRTVYADLVMKTTGNPYDVLPAVRSAVLSVLPDVPLRAVATMEESYSRRIAQRKLNMLLLGSFGFIGLIISAVGIYGVMAYVVSQRTREIGVRMALGATRGNVVGMVLRNACLLVAIGLVLGGVGAWQLSAASERFLFRLDATDPRAFVAAILSLSAAALIASAIPARRAAGVDPMVALRAE